MIKAIYIVGSLYCS